MITFNQNYPRFKAFWHKVALHFNEDACVYRASALTVTTLLALVPLAIVVLNILSAFHYFQHYAQKFTDVVLAHLVPHSGQVVRSYLLEFVNQASQLSIVGLIVLIITAVLLLYTIEQAINAIWRVPKRRFGIAMIIRYWAVLTLLPLLMVGSMALSSFVIHLPDMANPQANPWMISSFKFVLAIIIFSLLYGVIPNYRVPIRSVLLSALFAAICFSIVKKGFAIYVGHFSTYQMLYGTLATIPVFFIWLYCLWFITLLGAEVNRALVFRYGFSSTHYIDGFTHAVRWLKYLWHVQQTRGKPLTLPNLLQQDDCYYQVEPEKLMQHLQKLNLVRQVARGGYILNCDLQQVSVYELYKNCPWRLPSMETLSKQEKDNLPLIDALEAIEKETEKALSISLADLFKSL